MLLIFSSLVYWKEIILVAGAGDENVKENSGL